ncbi:MAG TPA: BBP7 family outer membrane beta-barrel protein [Gemmataceae bacterium]
MKRYRVRALGLGMALWGGTVQAAPPPVIVPPSARGEDWISSPVAADPVWRTVQPRTAAAIPIAPSPASAVPIPVSVKPDVVAPVVSRWPGTIGAIPIPEAASAIPVAPLTSPPAVTAPTIAAPPVEPLPEIPAPLPARPALPAPAALPVEVAQPAAPLPQPRTIPPLIPPAREYPESPRTRPQSQPLLEPELPTAPPELMVPAGIPVPGKYGTFGSQPVRISKDYPSIGDIMNPAGSGEKNWWEHWFGGFGRFGANANEGPTATDRLQFGAEYLLWWMNSQNVPVLATTSTNGGFGFLGDPATQTLLGSGPFGNTLRNGVRLNAGYWFDDCGTWGIGGSFFTLGRQTTSQVFGSNQFPTITRPFFAPNFPGEFGEIVAHPGISNGLLTINASSALWGLDANLRHALCKSCDFRSEVFVGYRFLDLRESLSMNESIVATPGNPNDPAGTLVSVTDSFRTQNLFNGGQVGYAAERIWGRFSVFGRGSIALGDTSQSLDIAGSQARLRPGMTTPDTFNGGLLATGPNLGHFQRDRFSVVPEITLNVGYWITPTLKAYLGYNFLYWSNVIRPGDQIDRVVDVTLVPNPPAGVAASGFLRPQPTFHQTDLVLNGIQFGLMGRW